MATRILATNCLSTNVRFCEMKRKVAHTFFDILWNYAPTLSKLITKRVFFSPSTYQATPAEKHYLNSAERFGISVHDQMVRCWKWGSGPAILLAHGWNGRGIQLHQFIEPLLQRGYSVIAYDAPGHGESHGKTSSYFEFTDTIRTLLTSSNGHEIRGVIAHSLGAAAVVNSMAKEDHALKPVLIAPALKPTEVLYSFFDAFGLPKPMYQNLIEEYEKSFGYTMRRDNPSDLLSGIKSKILIVHDKNDPTIPYVDSKDISDRLRNIELHTTERLGHKRILANESVVEFVCNYFGTAKN